MKKYTFVAYCVGVVSGYAIAYFTMKRTFEARVEAEVESVKETFRSLQKKDSVNERKESDNSSFRAEFINHDPLKKARDEAIKLARDNKYIAYNNLYGDEDVSIEEREKMKPKVIHPDDIDLSGMYRVIELTYYADGVITDENDEEFKDAEDYIGDDALKSFGKYSENAVYVWNGRLRVYYEILKDERTYAEVLEKYPYLKEDE